MTTEVVEAMTLRDILYDVLIWMSRATGIGYRRYPPLIGSEIDPTDIVKMTEQSDKLVRDVEQLHRELRRIGFPIPFTPSDRN